MPCADWLISMTYFSFGFDWLRKTVLFLSSFAFFFYIFFFSVNVLTEAVQI